VLKNYYKYTP